MPIRVLSPEVASQIAAGEVVERPASVVKELVENALDAGATSVSVALEGAGRQLIEVADDGRGIPSGELPLAVARHATSKLSNAEDLFRIATLGFRGEALASIGSVARLTITSRTAEAPSATRLRVEGGRAAEPQPVGAPVGTLVRVEDLFYNVPARLKFLKQDATERRQIDALVTRYALAYPSVRFRLGEGSNLSLQTSGDGDRRAILAALYGVETARQMLEVLAEEPGESGPGLRMDGYISPAGLTRSNRREITFFINGRWVQDSALTAALIQAYHTLLMVGRYPLAVVFLQVDPAEVDVNVHPAKAEVRFRQPDRIFSFVQRAARRALLAYAPVPALDAAPAASAWSAPSASQPAIDPAWEMPRTLGDSATPAGAATAGAPRLPLLRLIGQVGGTYLIAEGPDGLYLIDQHAAHERVLFEKLMALHGGGTLPAQALLQPAVVTLPPAAAALLTAQLPVLAAFGFDVQPFGPNAFQVRAMPALLGESDPGAALRAVVEDFEEDETPLQTEAEARIIARVCKRAAVKAGQALSAEEQRALLDGLEACASPRTCPHGRPTMVHLSVDMLERQFGRRGAR